MAWIGAFGNIAQGRLVDTIGRAAFEHEAPIAVTTVDVAVLVYLEIDLGMTKGCRTKVFSAADIAGAVTADASRRDLDDFGRGYTHAKADNR